MDQFNAAAFPPWLFKAGPCHLQGSSVSPLSPWVAQEKFKNKWGENRGNRTATGAQWSLLPHGWHHTRREMGQSSVWQGWECFSGEMTFTKALGWALVNSSLSWDPPKISPTLLVRNRDIKGEKPPKQEHWFTVEPRHDLGPRAHTLNVLCSEGWLQQAWDVHTLAWS